MLFEVCSYFIYGEIMFLRNNLGFTLAEVLITLGIIGVVASMTIPTLMNNIQDKAFKEAYKKTYSILTQAFSQVVSDNGGSIKNVFAGDTAGGESFKNALKQYLKYTTDCSGPGSQGGTGNGVSVDGCWHRANQWKDGNNSNMPEIAIPGLVLADGTLLRMEVSKSDCSFDMTPYNGNYTRCAYINVDINGFKPPNKIGKDIFDFDVLPNRILPYGSMPVDSTKVCSATSTANGWDCGVTYLYQ